MVAQLVKRVLQWPKQNMVGGSIQLRLSMCRIVWTNLLPVGMTAAVAEWVNSEAL